MRNCASKLVTENNNCETRVNKDSPQVPTPKLTNIQCFNKPNGTDYHDCPGNIDNEARQYHRR